MREAIRDRERLLHIDEAIERLLDGSKSRIDEIREGSLEYYGIVKLLEIIGEAVYKLTSDSETLMPRHHGARLNACGMFLCMVIIP